MDYFNLNASYTSWNKASYINYKVAYYTKSVVQPHQKVKKLDINANITPVISYESAGLQKDQILKECGGLRGIYRFTNKTNNKTYVGSGENLAKRFVIYAPLFILN